MYFLCILFTYHSSCDTYNAREYMSNFLRTSMSELPTNTITFFVQLLGGKTYRVTADAQETLLDSLIHAGVNLPNEGSSIYLLKSCKLIPNFTIGALGIENDDSILVIQRKSTTSSNLPLRSESSCPDLERIRRNDFAMSRAEMSLRTPIIYNTLLSELDSSNYRDFSRTPPPVTIIPTIPRVGVEPIQNLDWEGTESNKVFWDRLEKRFG